jgi:hypothetical protein
MQSTPVVLWVLRPSPSVKNSTILPRPSRPLLHPHQVPGHTSRRPQHRNADNQPRSAYILPKLESGAIERATHAEHAFRKVCLEISQSKIDDHLECFNNATMQGDILLLKACVELVISTPPAQTASATTQSSSTSSPFPNHRSHRKIPLTSSPRKTIHRATRSLLQKALIRRHNTCV